MPEFDIEVTCPACGASFTAPRIRQGRTEKCPVCQFAVRVGEAPEPTAPGEEEAPPVEGGLEPTPAREFTPEPVAVHDGSPMGLCTVCIRNEVKVNPMEVGPLISEMTDMPVPEAKRQVVRGHGVVAEDVPSEVAEQMVMRLKSLSVFAFAVDNGHVPRVERDLGLVRVYELEPEFLHLQTDVHGTVKRIPLGQLAAGFCTKTHVVRGGPTELETDVQIGFRGNTRTTYRAAARESDPDAECTLLLRGGSGALYRRHFAERQVRYTYLGSRLQASRSLNFAEFLKDLMRFGGRAFFPGSVEAVAAGGRSQVPQMKQKEDYTLYLHWVLCSMAERATRR